MQRFLRNDLEVDICEHGAQRFAERTALKDPDDQGNNAWNALCYGLRTKECKGYLRNCMAHYERSWFEEKGRELRYYKGLIYVFQGSCLVTLFPPRENVRIAAMKKCERQKIAKYAKCIREEYGDDIA